MPVIGNVPQDPTNLVIAGEQMRFEAITAHIATNPVMASTLVMETIKNTVVISGITSYRPMRENPIQNREILLNPNDCTLMGNNQGICTPCGAIVPHILGSHLMDGYYEANAIFTITGITKDSGGTALGGCRVVAMDTGQIHNAGTNTIVGEAVSDGSGNYSIIVPLNTNYHLIAYKPGSPDIAGITINTVKPNA
jgi:hypothetical protein